MDSNFLGSRTPLDRRWIMSGISLAIIASVCFAVGAGGPFVLDDAVNLAPLLAWANGQAGLWETVFGGSGPTGRPLAYLSLMANLAVGGVAPAGFKLVNVALHLATGALVFALLRHLHGLAPAPQSAPPHSMATPTGLNIRFGTATVVLVLTGAWLLHPQHVSTVLYTVQRMAQLGAIAQIVAVLVFLHARQLLPDRPGRAKVLMFLLFPAVLIMGSFAKETALLAPALCAAVHWAFPPDWSITGRDGAPTRRALRSFFGLFLLLPALAAALFLAWNPGWLLDGYAAREFTLAQRLLTQPRVLLDYAVGWFWPAPANLALFRDGYPHSAGLFQPPGTLVALAVLAAAAVAAAWQRRRRPWIAAGVAWFFAAHLLESTALPLEPYFEHRNYVASIGLLMVAFGLLAPLLGNLRAAWLGGLVLVLLVALASSTTWRSWQWSSTSRLLASEGPPEGEVSRRLQVDRAILEFQRGDREGAERALAVLATGGPGDIAAAALWSAIFACDADGALGTTLRDRIVASGPAVVTHNHVSYLEILARRVRDGTCRGLQPSDLAAVISNWRSQSTKPVTEGNRRRLEDLQQIAQGNTVP